MALTKVTGDFIKDGVLTQAHLHTSHGITTAHIGEGSNLYFTNARVDSRIGDLSTSNLSEGSNLYYTDARVASYLTTNSYATQSYVNTQVSNLVDSAPSTLDTLNELAAALGDDANFSTTVTNNIATKMPLAGGTFTGSIDFSAGQVKLRTDVALDHDGSSLYIKAPSTIYLYPGNANKGNINTSGTLTLSGGVSASSGTGHFSVVNASAYQLNGTYVMDSSRNLVNIAAITASGDFNVGGVRIVGDNDSADQGTAFIRSNGDYLVMSAADGEHVYLNWDGANGGSGHVYIDNSLFAQIFYDRNNTTYYFNGADTSVSAQVAGPIVSTGPTSGTTAGNRAFQVNTTTKGALHSTAASGGTSGSADTAPLVTFTGNGTTVQGGIYVSQNSSTGTTLGFFVTDSYATGPKQSLTIEDGGNVFVNRGLLQASASVRGQQFYDTNNTSYFLDPTSTTISLKAQGDIEVDGDIRGDYFVGTQYASEGYTIYKGYDNWNHMITVRGNTRPGQAKAQAAIVGAHITSFVEYAENNDSTGWWFTGSAGSTYAEVARITRSYSKFEGQLRSPIFYDSNNTTYYVDPNSTTSLRTVGAWRADSSTWDGEFNGKIQHHGNWWYMQASNGVLIRNSSGANNITLSASGVGTAANDWRAPRFYDSNDTTYFLDPAGTSQTRAISIMQGSGLNLYQSGNGSYAYQDARAEGSYSAVYKGTNNGSAYGEYREYWYDGDSYHSLRIAGNRFDFNAPLTVATDVRAPIFYDSGNTSYYVDPASNSVMNTINGFGFSQTGGNGKILVTNSGNGYLYLNNWIHVDGAGIFSSVNGAHFYPNQSSDYGAWRIQGTRNGWTGITFEVSGYYQNVMANANTIGFYNDTENEWMVECQRNSHTRLYYNGSEQAKTDNGYFSINNVLHTPIAYDSNNTGFYFDGASTSRVDSIMLRSTINFPVNSPGTTHASSHRPAYGIYQEGGAWSHPYPDLCIAMHTGIKLGANASYNGIRFYSDYQMSDGATMLMSINDSSSPVGASNVYILNTLLVAGQARAPIYYDSNNTNFYTRPSTSSLINHLYTDGTIQAGTSGTGNIYLGNNGGNGTGNHFRFHTNNSHTYFDGNCGDIHWRQGSSTRFIFYMTTANMTVNGTVTQNSDERIKENIITIDSALNKVNQLRGVYYNRTDINTSQKQIGLIAQEVENVIPEAVLTANDELGTKSISYGQINALLIEAIKEQQTIIDDLKSRIETLENQ